MKPHNGEMGGKKVAMVEGLCFGSLGRFAMEGGKVKLGCEWSRSWDAEQEQHQVVVVEDEEEEEEDAARRGLLSSSSSSSRSSSSSSSSSSKFVKLLQRTHADGGGSAEEEEAEDRLGGLAVQVAQSMLEEEISDRSVPWALDCPESAWSAATKKLSLPTSPQSTLAGAGNWNFSPSSSGSGGLSSGVSSPPTPVASSSASVPADDGDALDALYAELLRLKMEDQLKARQNQQQINLQRHLQQQHRHHHHHHLLLNMKLEGDSVSSKHSKATGTGLYFGPQPATGSRESRQEEQLLVSNQARSRKQPVGTGYWVQGHNSSKHRAAASTYWSENSSGGGNGSGSLGSAGAAVYPYHHQQQQQGQHHQVAPPLPNGSGMRAVFLSGRNSRESSGTGVFLPRRMGSAHDAKRKPACSTVLLPSRIVQALNLNIEDTLPCPPPYHTPSTSTTTTNVSPGILPRKDQTPVWRWGSLPTSDAPMTMPPVSHHHNSIRPLADSTTAGEQIASLQEVAPEISLPTEWTY